MRVAVALEGLNSPVEALIAGKTANAPPQAEAPIPAGENGQSIQHVPGTQNGQLIVDGGDDKATLVHRIRALRKRSDPMAGSGLMGKSR